MQMYYKQLPDQGELGKHTVQVVKLRKEESLPLQLLSSEDQTVAAWGWPLRGVFGY